MKFLRNILDSLHPQFDKGGKLEKLYPLYEAIDTFLYTPGEVTEGGVARARRNGSKADDGDRDRVIGALHVHGHVQHRLPGRIWRWRTWEWRQREAGEGR